jgi:hypothetical protein
MVDTLKEIVTSLFGVGYDLWNALIEVAMTLFTTSPTAAGGGVYQTAHNLYSSISDISLPIAIVFFLIAIIKEVTATPPDQQVRRFFNDVIKFGVMVGILANLWTIMGYIIQIADGLSSNLTGATNYTLTTPDVLSALLDTLFVEPDLQGTHFGQYIADFMCVIGYFFLFVIFGIVSIVILVASSVSILSSAFQRILKPLVLLPFSCVTVALAAGTGDAERVSSSYLKTFFGFCISGAFMVICISLGTALGNGLINIDTSSMAPAAQICAICVQNAVIPIIIAGLVKSADSIIAKFL